MSNMLSEGAADIAKALSQRRIWLALANEGISDAHRRTTLGPAWMLVNYLLFVGTFVLILGHVMPIENYPAFVAIGMLLWTYMSTAIGQGVNLFVTEEAMIKGTVLPLSTYVFKELMQELIRFGYAVVGCLIVLFLTGLWPSPDWLMALPGFALLVVATPPVILVMALLGARFRDLGFIINNLLRVAMFLTPVIWTHARGPLVLQWLSVFNPMTYFIELVREPIMGHAYPWRSLAIVTVMTLVLWAIALPMLGRYRRRVVFSL